jgi:hypothetical protein
MPAPSPRPPIEGDTEVSDKNFADRLAATGLSPSDADLPALRALVNDLDRAAALVRKSRDYSEEPLSAFRLPAPGE